MRLQHSLGVAHFALSSILNDLAGYLFLARVPLGEGVVDILRHKHEILLVSEILHSELVHVFHQSLVVDYVLVLLFYVILAIADATKLQCCAPLLPKRFLNNVVFCFIRQCLIHESL